MLPSPRPVFDHPTSFANQPVLMDRWALQLTRKAALAETPPLTRVSNQAVPSLGDEECICGHGNGARVAHGRYR